MIQLYEARRTQDGTPNLNLNSNRKCEALRCPRGNPRGSRRSNTARWRILVVIVPARLDLLAAAVLGATLPAHVVLTGMALLLLRPFCRKHSENGN